MYRARRFAAFLTWLAVLCAVSSQVEGTTISISHVDPQGQLIGFRSHIESHVLAAFEEWLSFLDNPIGSIEVVVQTDNSIPRATGRSVTSSFVRNSNNFLVYEQGAAAEIKSGNDPNGIDFDVEISFNTNYVTNELWFDSDPVQRTAVVPTNRTDGMSVFLHELGHAIGFNGWFDTAGNLPADYMSTFDEHVVTSPGGQQYFHGPLAVAEYGEPVPLTFQNPSHLGNNAPRPGTDLRADLMNGVVFFSGTRYFVSELDLAILTDVGLPVLPPLPDADINGDGAVDGADLGGVFSVWGSGGGAADLNDDGLIDGADVAEVYSQWMGDVNTAPMSVPEPAAAWCSAAVAGWIVLARQRRSCVAGRYVDA